MYTFVASIADPLVPSTVLEIKMVALDKKMESDSYIKEIEDYAKDLGITFYRHVEKLGPSHIHLKGQKEKVESFLSYVRYHPSNINLINPSL